MGMEDDNAVAAAAATAVVQGLTRKLQHPVESIRRRAVEVTLQKLRTGLLPVSQVASRSPSEIHLLVLACIQILGRNEFEDKALAVLEILVERCGKAIRRDEAASELQKLGLQRAKAGRDHAMYDKLLKSLLVTMTDRNPVGAAVPTASSNQYATKVDDGVRTRRTSTRHAPTASESRVQVDLDVLQHAGWRFVPVRLHAKDEQALLEFEVKLKLRTSVQDIVAMCRQFRTELLRDFPVEIFLQRTATIQHLMQLLQAPVLVDVPASSGSQTELVDRVLDLPFGINYFDEVGSATFSRKQAPLCTAVFIACTKAIESFICALRHSVEFTSNPGFGVFESTLSMDVDGGYHQQKQYPRSRLSRTTMEEIEDLSETDATSFSVSGVVVAILVKLLRLLRSRCHPHIHIMGIIHAAFPFVQEMQTSNHDVHPLDKQRIELIFEEIKAVIVEHPLDSAHWLSSVRWNLLHLVLRLCHLYPSASYTISDPPTSGVIGVPRPVWNIVRSCAANAGFEHAAQEEWGESCRFSEVIANIDPEFDHYVNCVRKSEEKADLIRWVSSLTVEQSSSRSIKCVSPTLEQCAEIVAAAREIPPSLHADVASIISEPIERHVRENTPEASIVPRIFSKMFSGLSDPAVKSFALHFFKTLPDVCACGVGGDGSWKYVIDGLLHVDVTKDLVRAMISSKDAEAAQFAVKFFNLVVVGLLQKASNANLSEFKTFIPLFQHFAYLSGGTILEQNLKLLDQYSVARLVNALEDTCDAAERVLLICRCLLHNVPNVRKSAVAGLFRFLTEIDPSAFDAVCHGNLFDDRGIIDPFCYSRNPKSSVKSHIIETSPRSEGDNKYVQEMPKRLLQVTMIRKLINSSKQDTILPQTALKEFVGEICSWPPEFIVMLEESGECDEIMKLIPSLTASPSIASIWLCLQLVVNLSFKSAYFRNRLGQQLTLLTKVLPFCFHEDDRIRAQMYHVVLILTCSEEQFALESSTAQNGTTIFTLPSHSQSSFGLHADTWDRCHFRVSALSNIESTPQQPQQHPTKMFGGNSVICMGTSRNDLTTLLTKLRIAHSQSNFLNITYHLLHLCSTSKCVQTEMASIWQQEFERYVQGPPKSERDEIVVGALVAVMTSVFTAMDRSPRLDLLKIAKKVLIPSLRAARTELLLPEVLRLIVRMQRFGAPHITICELLDRTLAQELVVMCTSSSIRSRVVTALILECWCGYLHDFRAQSNQISSASSASSTRHNDQHDAILDACGMLIRHHAPGSFTGSEVFCVAAQVLQLLRHRSASLPVDVFSVFVFDMLSPVRASAFALIIEGLQMSQTDEQTKIRFLRIAADVAADPTECDIVRGMAVDAMLSELTKFGEHEPGYQDQVIEIFGGLQLAANLQSELTRILTSEMHLVSYGRSVTRALRLLLQHEHLRVFFGNVDMQQLSDSFLVVMADSLSFARYDHYHREYSGNRLSIEIAEISTVQSAFHITVVELMAEILLLLLQLCQNATTLRFFDEQTTLKYTVATLIRDAGISLLQLRVDEVSTASSSLTRLIAGGVDCFKTLVLPQTTASALSSLDSTTTAIIASLSATSAKVLGRSEFAIIHDDIATLFATLSLGKWRNSFVIQDSNTLTLLASNLASGLKDSFHDGTDATVHHKRFCRLAHVLQVLVERLDGLRKHVRSKRILEYCVHQARQCFEMIRAAGGFGSKMKLNLDKGTINSAEKAARLLGLLGSLVLDDSSAQRVALENRILDDVTANWIILRMSHSRGSSVFTCALRMLQNLLRGNDLAKTMVAAAGNRDRTRAETERSLLSLVNSEFLELESSGYRPSGGQVHSLCAEILKMLLTNSDAVKVCIKHGYIAKYVNAAHANLRAAMRNPEAESSRSATLLSVLAAAACSVDGRTAVCACSPISEIVFDVLQSEDKQVQLAGCLLIRNISFAQLSKGTFALWERALDRMVHSLCRSQSAEVVEHLGCALWSLVFDNQKARTMLRASAKNMRGLEFAVKKLEKCDDGNQAAATNLKRLFLLMEVSERTNPSGHQIVSGVWQTPDSGAAPPGPGPGSLG